MGCTLLFIHSKGERYLQMRGGFRIWVRFCAKQSLQDRVVIDMTLSFHPRFVLTKKRKNSRGTRNRERERIERMFGREDMYPPGGICSMRCGDLFKYSSNVFDTSAIYLIYARRYTHAWIRRMINAAHAWRTADARFSTSTIAIWQAFLLAIGR